MLISRLGKKFTKSTIFFLMAVCTVGLQPHSAFASDQHLALQFCDATTDAVFVLPPHVQNEAWETTQEAGKKNLVAFLAVGAGLSRGQRIPTEKVHPFLTIEKQVDGQETPSFLEFRNALAAVGVPSAGYGIKSSDLEQTYRSFLKSNYIAISVMTPLSAPEKAEGFYFLWYRNNDESASIFSVTGETCVWSLEKLLSMIRRNPVMLVLPPPPFSQQQRK